MALTNGAAPSAGWTISFTRGSPRLECLPEAASPRQKVRCSSGPQLWLVFVPGFPVPGSLSPVPFLNPALVRDPASNLREIHALWTESPKQMAGAAGIGLALRD